MKKTPVKPSKNLKIFAQNIINRRKMLNISQERLAELCNLHRTYIGQVERCEKNISMDSMEKIAEALGLTVLDLLTPEIIEEKIVCCIKAS